MSYAKNKYQVCNLCNAISLKNESGTNHVRKNESRTNHETRTNQERIINKERIGNPFLHYSHKLTPPVEIRTPTSGNMSHHPLLIQVENYFVDPTSGNWYKRFEQRRNEMENTIKTCDFCEKSMMHNDSVHTECGVILCEDCADESVVYQDVGDEYLIILRKD